MTNRVSHILLDRDGTVIADKHYLHDPAQVELLPGVLCALQTLVQQGCRLYLVSNQSGVGRGFFSEEDVLACNRRLGELLAPAGVYFTDSVFCLHTPDDACNCRKPKIDMWQHLQQRHGLVAEQCIMVGDKPEDMQFAAAAGLAARILVRTGKGESSIVQLGLEEQAMQSVQEQRATALDPPLYILPSLAMLPEVVMVMQGRVCTS